MNTITLFRKLKERGYATNSAVSWHTCDLTDAMYNAGYTESDIFSMDDDDRKMILGDFFDSKEEVIIEFISNLLTDYLRDELESVTPTKDPF